MTGIIGDANIGGFWPPELKFAGYDQLIIHGCSNDPTYLFINDDKVERRDAVHLWGKDACETTKLLKEELYKVTDDRDIQILCIGQAGENKVASAAITGWPESSASRTGVGAVMGSKNLKAIAVRGTSDIAIAKPKELTELCLDILEQKGPLKEMISQIWGMLRDHEKFAIFGNYEETVPEELRRSGEIEKMCKDFCDAYRRETGCFNCPIPCQSYLEIPGAGFSVLRCDPWFHFSLRLKTMDFAFSAKLLMKCQKLGIDAFAVAADTAFLMDLYEKGIITEKDTDGIQMKWGNKEAMELMAEKIAKREGCGELFAEGIKKAAQKIGRGAEDYAFNIKGMELCNYSLYPIDQALSSATGQRGDSYRGSASYGFALMYASKEELEYIKTELPKDVAEWVDEDYVKTYEGKARYVTYIENANTLSDLLGLCKWATRFIPFGIIPPSAMAPLLAYATGKNLTENELNVYSQRVDTLIRAYNIREGLRRKDDKLPKFLFETASPRFGFKLDQERFDALLNEYYELRGWDKNGIPKTETLERLNLNYVADELKIRKII